MAKSKRAAKVATTAKGVGVKNESAAEAIWGDRSIPLGPAPAVSETLEIRALEEPARRLFYLGKVYTSGGAKALVAAFESLLSLGENPAESSARAVVAATTADEDIRHGRKFVGKKKGSEGPFKRAIRRLLANDPKLTSKKIIAHFKAKPPRGWTFSPIGQRFVSPTNSKAVTTHTVENHISEVRRDFRRRNKRVPSASELRKRASRQDEGGVSGWDLPATQITGRSARASYRR